MVCQISYFGTFWKTSGSKVINVNQQFHLSLYILEERGSIACLDNINGIQQPACDSSNPAQSFQGITWLVLFLCQK
jgi:hypothetical protein